MTEATDSHELFETLPNRLSTEEYNFAHFRTQHLLMDVDGTLKTRGIQPGELAPEFELPFVGEGKLRLSNLRDKPVVLHFGSFT